MDRGDALHLLASEDAHQRLLAARFFAQHAGANDEAPLREALVKERVGWIIGALKQALRKIGPTKDMVPEPSSSVADIEDDVARQVRSSAVEETARRLLHEIEPILGNLRLAGVREVRGYDSSRTKALHDQLDHVLEAISTLSRSASVPRNAQFDLADIAYAAAAEEGRDRGVQVSLAGRRPHIVRGDATLINLALRNGLKNAVEATLTVGEEDRKPIVVTWGETDIDYWLAVVDRATGLPRDARHLGEIGTSSKPGHLGMGLAIAKSAVSSMGGKVVLHGREEGGTRFEFRWPIPEMAKE